MKRITKTPDKSPIIFRMRIKNVLNRCDGIQYAAVAPAIYTNYAILKKYIRA
jgi:hypothetical protein